MLHDAVLPSPNVVDLRPELSTILTRSPTWQADFRPDELEEFKEAFALFDDNGSGQIEARCLPINAIVPVSYRL